MNTLGTRNSHCGIPLRRFLGVLILALMLCNDSTLHADLVSAECEIHRMDWNGTFGAGSWTVAIPLPSGGAACTPGELIYSIPSLTIDPVALGLAPGTYRAELKFTDTSGVTSCQAITFSVPRSPLVVSEVQVELYDSITGTLLHAETIVSPVDCQSPAPSPYRASLRNLALSWTAAPGSYRLRTRVIDSDPIEPQANHSAL